MTLDTIVALAASKQASDLHLEPGLKPTLRVRGELVAVGEGANRETLAEMAHTVVGSRHWDDFVRQRSFDRAMTIAGVRCRVNVLHSMRGIGLAIRLLPAHIPTIEGLNLHPDLKKLALREHGLLLISGATGSGKSSTLAALLQEINTTQARHIITIEQPIEYRLKPVRSFIRQREVGSDTASFEQALIDAMREDPDVIMVGEMRDPECMRLTLNAAETGHLVLATLHSATVAEALQRVVLAFPAEIQSGIAAQLADSFIGVLSQRLHFRPDIGMQIPECELLLASSASKSVIRQGDFSKLTSVLETGAAEGMYTYDRYRRWLDSRTRWSRVMTDYRGPADADPEPPHRRASARAPSPTETRNRTAGTTAPAVRQPVPRHDPEPASAPVSSPAGPEETVFEIEPVEHDLNSLLQELDKRSR